MILTVTPNPALDLTWHVDALRPGASHRVDAGVARAGGKGLNVSRVLHQTGHDTQALTTCGGTTGAEFRAELESSGVSHTLIDVAAATRRSIALVDTDAGEATVLNEFGTALDDADTDRFWSEVRRRAVGATAVAISGSLPRGTDPQHVVTAVRDLRAGGVPVVVDTSGAALVAAADAGASVLKPNDEELREATGHDDIEDGIADLLARGVRCVVASLGAEGLLVAHRDGHRVRARFPETVHGNATGAGDAVTAAITVSLAADPTLTAADALTTLARRAAAWGAAAVAMPLAGSVDPAFATRTDDVIITAWEISA